MRHYCIALCAALLLAACGAGSNLNIVSPSASDDEVKKRASAVMSEKTSPVTKERPASPPAAQGASSESAKPGEIKPSEEPSMKGVFAEQALINLLERKGIITRKELMEEIKRLEQGGK